MVLSMLARRHPVLLTHTQQNTPAPYMRCVARMCMEPKPPLKKTNSEVIRLAGLRLMLVESDARKAIDAIESGRIDLARVYMAGVVETMQAVYLKDVEQ